MLNEEKNQRDDEEEKSANCEQSPINFYSPLKFHADKIRMWAEEKQKIISTLWAHSVNIFAIVDFWNVTWWNYCCHLCYKNSSCSCSACACYYFHFHEKETYKVNCLVLRIVFILKQWKVQKEDLDLQSVRAVAERCTSHHRYPQVSFQSNRFQQFEPV